MGKVIFYEHQVMIGGEQAVPVPGTYPATWDGYDVSFTDGAGTAVLGRTLAGKHADVAYEVDVLEDGSVFVVPVMDPKPLRRKPV